MKPYYQDGMNREIKFVELFAGIGGFRYGLEKVGRLQQGMERPRRGRFIESNGGKPQFDSERWLQGQADRDSSKSISRGDPRALQYHREPTEGEERTNGQPTEFSCGDRQQQENTETQREEVGISNKVQQPNQSQKRGKYTCVWANDNDKYASQIYRKRFGSDLQSKAKKYETIGVSPQPAGKSLQGTTNSKNWHEPSRLYEGDIRTVDPAIIPEHDLICAGFPCQSFSTAGKRGGFEDTRGTLFFEIMRIARAKRTPYLLLENVKGLLSHDEGDTFQTILRTLDEFGYDCQWQVLNSNNFGVLQNRERVFIIGHLRGQPRVQVFPLGETDQVYPEPDGQISHAIDSNYHKGWLDNQQRTMIRTRRGK